jgi:hypothetical protein
MIMIVFLFLMQSALPPATSESTNPETRTDRFEFHWEWSSSNNDDAGDSLSEIDRANEDRRGRTGGWVEVSPGVYEYQAPESAAEGEDDWGLGGHDFRQSENRYGRLSAQEFGNCTPEEYRRRRAAADSMGIERTGCEIDRDAAREAAQEAEADAEDDTPAWNGRVQLAPETPED